MSLVRRDFKAATASGCVYKSGGVEDGTSLHVTLNGWDVALFLPLSLTLCPLEFHTSYTSVESMRKSADGRERDISLSPDGLTVLYIENTAVRGRIGLFSKHYRTRLTYDCGEMI
ncbi:hypothetical protein OUZ56_002955 [Daphnia magna]|uniref:Uncharacterized protein n=1 Tax=Daphnia magna TaxID=35525 RepID=A0ABR0A7B8_9CRUS|nr:hypothetical protein OUZ56_002955 [Daphnia magna]